MLISIDKNHLFTKMVTFRILKFSDINIKGIVYNFKAINHSVDIFDKFNGWSLTTCSNVFVTHSHSSFLLTFSILKFSDLFQIKYRI